MPSSHISESAQIARILGLPQADSFDELKLVDSLARGVPATSVEHLVRVIDPDGICLRPHDLVPKATLHRHSGDGSLLSSETSERLWQVVRVYVEALRHYHSASEALAYLFRGHPLLAGRRPFDLARKSSSGADLVMKLLAQAEAGVAV